MPESPFELIDLNVFERHVLPRLTINEAFSWLLPPGQFKAIAIDDKKVGFDMINNKEMNALLLSLRPNDITRLVRDGGRLLFSKLLSEGKQYPEPIFYKVSTMICLKFLLAALRYQLFPKIETIEDVAKILKVFPEHAVACFLNLPKIRSLIDEKLDDISKLDCLLAAAFASKGVQSAGVMGETLPGTKLLDLNNRLLEILSQYIEHHGITLDALLTVCLNRFDFGKQLFVTLPKDHFKCELSCADQIEKLFKLIGLERACEIIFVCGKQSLLLELDAKILLNASIVALTHKKAFYLPLKPQSKRQVKEAINRLMLTNIEDVIAGFLSIKGVKNRMCLVSFMGAELVKAALSRVEDIKIVLKFIKLFKEKREGVENSHRFLSMICGYQLCKPFIQNQGDLVSLVCAVELGSGQYAIMNEMRQSAGYKLVATTSTEQYIYLSMRNCNDHLQAVSDGILRFCLRAKLLSPMADESVEVDVRDIMFNKAIEFYPRYKGVVSRNKRDAQNTIALLTDFVSMTDYRNWFFVRDEVLRPSSHIKAVETCLRRRAPKLSSKKSDEIAFEVLKEIMVVNNKASLDRETFNNTELGRRLNVNSICFGEKSTEMLIRQAESAASNEIDEDDFTLQLPSLWRVLFDR
jgi:hypothetical protein